MLDIKKLLTKFQNNSSNNYSQNIETILNSQIVYDNKELLGKGTYGDVYIGYNKKTSKLVAVKLVKTTNDPSSFSFKSLHWQLQALQHINGQNVISYIGHQYDLNKCHIVSQLCCQTLYQKLKRMRANSKTISLQLVKEVLLLYRKTIKGVLEIHRAGYIHRDLKPENILIGIDQQPKIADFGLCGKISEARPTTEWRIGSKPYMSPEVIQYGQYSEKSDVWSLGITLFQMIFSCHPFSDRFYQNPSIEKCYDELSLIKQKLKAVNSQTRISQVLLKIYDKIISQCLKINTEKRISVQSLLNQLNKIMEEFEIHSTKNQFKQALKASNPQKSQRVYDRFTQFFENLIQALEKAQHKATVKLRSFLLQAKSKTFQIEDQKIVEQSKICFKKLGSLLKLIKSDKDFELYKVEVQILQNLQVLIEALSDKQNTMKEVSYIKNTKRNKSFTEKLLKFVSVI